MTAICDGRVCIITGAGRGLGRQYALALAQQGAHVVVNDLGSQRDGSGADAEAASAVVEEITSTGGTAVANTDDVSEWAGAERLIRQTLEVFGRLDVLVNNAGILRDRMLVNMTEADWDAVMKVHLKGTFAPSRHAAAYWRERAKAGETNDARLINTTSASGLYANPGQSNYGAAKAAIAAFTIIAARELGRYGVTVNAIAPGAATRLTEDLFADEESKKKYDPKYVAPLCVWLASPLSRGYTEHIIEASGVGLAVAAGWHRGPTAAPVVSLEEVDTALQKLLAEARPHATMHEQ